MDPKGKELVKPLRSNLRRIWARARLTDLVRIKYEKEGVKEAASITKNLNFYFQSS